MKVSGVRVSQAEETASASPVGRTAGHVRRATKKPPWLERSGKMTSVREWGQKEGASASGRGDASVFL